MKGSCRYGVIEEYVSVVDEEECGREVVSGRKLGMLLGLLLMVVWVCRSRKTQWSCLFSCTVVRQ